MDDVCVMVMTGDAKPAHCFGHPLSPTVMSCRFVRSNRIMQYFCCRSYIFCWFAKVRVSGTPVGVGISGLPVIATLWQDALFELECEMCCKMELLYRPAMQVKPRAIHKRHLLEGRGVEQYADMERAFQCVWTSTM